MLKTLILSAIFSLLFIPTISLACSCARWTSNLNLALDRAEHVVLAKVEEFINHGAKLSIEQELKGETGQETILTWGDPGHLCRDRIPSNQLGKRILILLNKIEKPSNFLNPSEEKAGDFQLISCASSTYNVIEDEQGVLSVKGNLVTQEGSDQLSLSDLQKWIDKPEYPRKLANDAHVEKLMTDPHISCFPTSYIYVKKDNEQRAFTSFYSYNNTLVSSLSPRVEVNKDLQYYEKNLTIELLDSWNFDTETSNEDKKKVEEWIEEHNPTLRLSIHLTHQDGFQNLLYKAEAVVGTENPMLLYTQTISISKDAFKNQALNTPWDTFFKQNEALLGDTKVDFPYVLPIVDGYELEISSTQTCVAR